MIQFALYQLIMEVHSLEYDYCAIIIPNQRKKCSYLFRLITPFTFHFTLLGYGSGPVGLWVMLFIYSKVPELIDTVFIVLRKKKLIFLHWYHHVTVLLYCWHAFSTLAGTGLYFVAMNYSVHAVMYGYYCLQALHMLPRSFPTVLITVAQITQMFVGTGVCMSAWFYKLSNQPCHNETSNLVAGGIMYGSYLYLFCDFAFGRYLRKTDKAPKKVQ